MILDYMTLRLIWWVCLGLLLIGFAIMGGFDLGVGMLLQWAGRDDGERRVILNTVGPTWEGNQVWFILGGGAIFAAWPALYAVSFSGFYLAMFVVLSALIIRPVGFKYRSKLDNPIWRTTWDWGLFIGGFVPSLIFGVAVANVMLGVPFYFDETLRPFYTGSFWALLNPFALLGGLVSVAMLMQQGGLFLALKTEHSIRRRAIWAARFGGILFLMTYNLTALWLYWGVDGYVLTSPVMTDGPSNPLYKTMETQAGAWFANYFNYPILLALPAFAVLGSLMALLTAKYRQSGFALCASSLSIFGVIAGIGVSMFPVILPSSTHPGHSLLVWDASSSQLTLFIMTVATAIFLPIIILYTAWVYKILKGKVNLASIMLQDDAY